MNLYILKVYSHAALLLTHSLMSEVLCLVHRSGSRAPGWKAHKAGSSCPCKIMNTCTINKLSIIWNLQATSLVNFPNKRSTLYVIFFLLPCSNHQLVVLCHQSEVTSPLWLPAGGSFILLEKTKSCVENPNSTKTEGYIKLQEIDTWTTVYCNIHIMLSKREA